LPRRWIHLAALFAITLPLLGGCAADTKNAMRVAASTDSAKGIHQEQSVRGVSPLVDKHWVQDPRNYYETQNVVINKAVSVPILEYHEAKYVPGDIATLKPGQFLSEIEWLHRHNFHTINFGQLYAAMYHGYKLPPRPIILTFDDGYESVYFNVYPLLKKYHDQAALFVIAGYTHEKPDRKKEFPNLTIPELREMQASGLVDVEDHTMTHPDLRTLSESKAQYEIHGSAQVLEKIVNHPMLFFCYPDGGYTQETISLVRKAGYLLAVTQNGGYANWRQGPWTLHRISVLDFTTLQDFAKKLSPSLS
jgi:peptidoglycan/xylan/chitin deacetylase (PgdA/CDA1 family)